MTAMFSVNKSETEVSDLIILCYFILFDAKTVSQPLGHFLTVLCKWHVVLHKRFKVLSMRRHILDSLLTKPQVTPGVTLQLVT